MTDNKPKIKKVVDWDELYPGRFLKAPELKGKVVTLTVKDVWLEELHGNDGPEMKGVVSFERTEKQLALNKTNGILIKAMFGRDVTKWAGRKISIHEEDWSGDPCIRVCGSPELESEKRVEVILPRRKPIYRTMKPTR